MAFNPNPFEQAREEVAKKSMGSQIAHSSMFHSIRSGFSSGGSFGSKGLGAALGVGKLFLALIPVPIVGSVVGAAADAINSKVRGALHERHLGDNASNKDIAKFGIKELTVENLDRYRWKVAHSFEELNAGIKAFNVSNQGCDDMYNFTLLYEQVQRRKTKLKEELDKFQKVIKAVDAWIAELEADQGVQVTKAMNQIMEKSAKNIAEINSLQPDTNPAHRARKAVYESMHVDCKNWCYFKKQAKYDPNTRWETVKEWTGKASNFLKPIAVTAIAVRKSDYTASSDNSKFS